jgi:riboflavin kinase/FMN adenylyltransferase
MGHQIIFRRTAERAKEKNGTSIIFTFEPHPLKIIAPERVPPLLSTFRKKMQCIEECGIDQVICADFNRQFADQRPRDFASNILMDKIGVKEIFVGFDYAFGRGREGTIQYLKKMGDTLGFDTHIVEPIKIAGHLVSSSYVRELVEEGQVKRAREFLGRYYSIQGPVIHGYKTGEAIGFPTANIDTSKVQIPGTGVYAVRIHHGGKVYGGVSNIGFNPTFHRDRLSVEVHIFDFADKIYGEEVEVEFIDRIRSETEFDSAEALVVQIKQDIQKAKTLIGHAPP